MIKQEITSVLPAINKIIFDTEKQLSTLMGVSVKVKLSYDNEEVAVTAIEQIICQEFNISWSDLISSSRKKNLVTARMLYAYYAYLTTKALPMKDIGKRINRHHSSIVHYIKRTKSLLSVNDAYLLSYKNNIELAFKRI